MSHIDGKDYQKRLDDISEIFSQILQHADELSTQRCPYRDRLDNCTAKFCCRNQSKPVIAGALPVCTGDEKIDYRSAWETS